jgi:hypothetical protein
VVDDDAEEQCQADGGYHPSAAQVRIHVRLVVLDQRNEAQCETGNSSDGEPNDDARSALALRKGKVAQKRGKHQSKSSLQMLVHAANTTKLRTTYGNECVCQDEVEDGIVLQFCLL